MVQSCFVIFFLLFEDLVREKGSIYKFVKWKWSISFNVRIEEMDKIWFTLDSLTNSIEKRSEAAKEWKSQQLKKLFFLENHFDSIYLNLLKICSTFLLNSYIFMREKYFHGQRKAYLSDFFSSSYPNNQKYLKKQTEKLNPINLNTVIYFFMIFCN